MVTVAPEAPLEVLVELTTVVSGVVTTVVVEAGCTVAAGSTGLVSVRMAALAATAVVARTPMAARAMPMRGAKGGKAGTSV